MVVQRTNATWVPKFRCCSTDGAFTVRDMTPDQQALIQVMRETFGELGIVGFPEVWGPRVVVRADTSQGAIYAKAAGDADVGAEAVAIRLAGDAGVPVPRVLTRAADGRVPGGCWFAMSAVEGVEWEAENQDLAPNTLHDVARCLARLHRVTPTGFGSLDRTGNATCDSWPGWVVQTARGYLDRLVEGDHVTGDYVHMAMEVFQRAAPAIDRGSLVHGDLTGSETLVDPSDGRIVGIVDWGGVVVADPVYEFATLQAGGPADDLTPKMVLPKILNDYVVETGMDRARIDRTLPLYQAHQALGNADWCRREGVPWIEGLVNAAEAWLRAL